MVNFSAGISALQANQTALGVVAHNIANANTPGFSRREALFQENPSVNINGLFIGQGVSVDVIRRTQNEAAKMAMLGVMSDGAGTELRLETAQQVEAILAPGNGSLLDRFETFFNELERLSAFPDDSALRTTVVRSADSLASEIRHVSERLNGYSAQLDLQIQESINDISHRVSTVAAINAELVRVSSTGDAQDLLDRRDLAVQELAQLVDVKIQSKPGGDFQILIGGVIPITDAPLNINAVINSEGQLEIRHPLCEDGLHVTGGQLGGMLAARNDSVGRYQKQLDEMVEQLVAEFDTAHASGIGVRDSITQMTSMRDVTNLDVPMAQVNLALPVTAGELFVNVTDAAGQMSMHRIEINPGAQTVRDLGALISEIEGLEAFIPDNGGTFGIIAEDGFSFDFTGNVPEQPLEVSMAGTAVPRMEGRRSESGNELYEFRFAEDGLVGINDPLPLEVLDGNGQLVTLLNVGAGYEPGSPLEVTPGVFVRIENGSVNAGDSFSSYVVGDPDTSGFLAAAGLNTFFQGNNAKNIEVNEALLANPAMLATTTTGNPSDTTNLQRMVAVRDKRIFSNGTQTLEQYVTDIIAGVGLDVSDLEQIATNNGDLQATLQGQIESSSGVDVNEEVARMLQFQRSLQAAAQYISTQNEVLAELLATIT